MQDHDCFSVKMRNCLATLVFIPMLANALNNTIIGNLTNGKLYFCISAYSKAMNFDSDIILASDITLKHTDVS